MCPTPIYIKFSLKIEGPKPPLGKIGKPDEKILPRLKERGSFEKNKGR